MEDLLYQGHGSYRIVSDEGVVIYVDPYAGEGYKSVAKNPQACLWDESYMILT